MKSALACITLISRLNLFVILLFEANNKMQIVVSIIEMV